MNTWCTSLSGKQKLWLLFTISAMIGIVLLGLYLRPQGSMISSDDFNLSNSISDIAPRLGVTGKALAKELGLDLDAPKRKPLESLGVSNESMQHAVEHLLSHRDASVKYYAYAALVLGALIFLVRVGRPDGVKVKERKKWYPRLPYNASLAVSVIVCGFMLGKSPNPMEGAVKVFKSMVGLYPDPMLKLLAFLFFIVLAVVGNKLICGWACPFGALQELIYSLPLFRKAKRRKLPFWLTNGVRTITFLTMLAILFGIAGGHRGMVIYHYINPFNLFNLDFESALVLMMVAIALTLSFAVYRPFCQIICPFGLLSWLFERFAVTSVRISHDTCTKCGACVKACPTHAAKGKVDQSLFVSDCFSCARCLNTCPVDALAYRTIVKR